MIADASVDFCYVTTRGRRSGAQHRIEIWFAAAPDRSTIYLLSGGRDRSDWVRNLLAEPACTVEIGAARYAGTARVLAPGTAEDALARTLVYDKYREQDDLDQWRDASLPVAIDLEPL